MTSMATDDRRRAAALTAAIACIAVFGVGLSLSVPLLAFTMEARGASRSLIGANTAMGGLATIVVAPFIPRLIRSFGARLVLCGSILLGVATLLAFYVAPLGLWFPLRFLYGAALSVLFVVSEFWINAAAPPERRGLVIGIYGTVLSLGFATGPGILAAIGSEGLLPFVMGAVLFLLAMVPILPAGHLVPEISDRGRGRGIPYFVTIAPVATLSGLVFGMLETSGLTFLPLYAAGYGHSQASASLLISMMAIGNVTFQLPLGMLSDRMNRRRLLTVLAALGALGPLLLPLATSSIAVLCLIVGLWGGVTGGLYTVGLAHLGSRFTGSDLATANAAFVVMYSTGMLIGPPIAGGAMDLVGPSGLPAVLAGVCAILAVIALARSRS